MYEVLFLSGFQYNAQGEVVYYAYGKFPYYRVHKHDGYRSVLADAGFLCGKAAVLGNSIKGTLCKCKFVGFCFV
jgi:hypothetical protein